MPHRLHPIDTVWLATLALVPLIVLWPFRHAGFVSDDVFFGPGFEMASWWDALTRPWPHSMHVSNAWRPLVVLTYLVQAAWTDGSPVGYHVANDLLHGVNAALLAVLAWQLTREGMIAAIAGMLFAVHPIVHENVQWIAGRTYPLAALFTLLLCIWSASAQAPRRRAWVQHAVGLPLLVAALASYEFAIVSPIAAVAVAYVAWGRPREAWPRLLRFACPYLAVLAAYFCLRWLWLTSFDADVMLAARASSWAPVGPIAYRVPRNTMFWALRLLAWPWFERGSDIRVGLTGVLTTVLAGWMLMSLVKSPRYRAPGFVALFLAVLFFAPVSTAMAFSDRFGYLSAAALTLAIAVASAATTKRRTFTMLLIVVALLWTHDLRAHGHEWMQAGRIASNIVRQIREREPPPDEPTRVHVIDVPVRHGAALVYLTYFPLAVTRAYPPANRSALSIAPDIGSDEDVVERVREQALTNGQRARVYRWLPKSERLALVWRQD